MREGLSDGADCRCLRPAIAVLDVELDPLPLLEAAVAIHLDGGEVHEHVPTTVDRDEAVALVRVEPLDGALSHYPTTPYLRSGLSGPAPCYRGTLDRGALGVPSKQACRSRRPTATGHDLTSC